MCLNFVLNCTVHFASELVSEYTLMLDSKYILLLLLLMHLLRLLYIKSTMYLEHTQIYANTNNINIVKT